MSDRLITGIGFNLLYLENMNGYINYDISLGDDAQDHCFSIGMNFMW